MWIIDINFNLFFFFSLVLALLWLPWQLYAGRKVRGVQTCWFSQTSVAFLILLPMISFCRGLLESNLGEQLLWTSFHPLKSIPQCWWFLTRKSRMGDAEGISDPLVMRPVPHFIMQKPWTCYSAPKQSMYSNAYFNSLAAVNCLAWVPVSMCIQMLILMQLWLDWLQNELCLPQVWLAMCFPCGLGTQSEWERSF